MNCYRKAWRLGLRGVFHDSHFNLATDTINYLHGDYGSEEHAADPDAFAYPSDVRGTDQVWSIHHVSLGLKSRLQNEVGLFYNVESDGALGTSHTSPDYEFLRGNEYIYNNMDSPSNSATSSTTVTMRRLCPSADFRPASHFRSPSTLNAFSAPTAVASW
jgi:hypothetical protein